MKGLVNKSYAVLFSKILFQENSGVLTSEE